MRTRTFIFLGAVLFAVSSAYAQTVIRNGEKVSGTWTPKGSPYIIMGEATVPVGSKLKIKPGTIIRFKTGENRDYGYPEFDLGFLRVNGVIKASGSKEKPVVFTRQGDDGYWGVVQLHSRQNGSILKGCRFEYGYYIRGIVPDDNATGVLSVYEGTAEITNCLIVNNGWAGINCKQGANPVVMNCTVALNNYGIECNSASSPTIINTIVWGNESDNFFINGGSLPLISYSLIEDSDFPFGLVDGGNNLPGKNPRFEDFLKFRLLPDSPCIKAGKDQKNIGADM